MCGINLLTLVSASTYSIWYRQPLGIFSGVLMYDLFTETRLDTLVIELPLGSRQKEQKETFDWTCARVKFGWEDTRDDDHVDRRKQHRQRAATGLGLAAIQCQRLDNTVIICFSGQERRWVGWSGWNQSGFEISTCYLDDVVALNKKFNLCFD